MSADTPPTETGGNLPPVEEASIYHLLKPEVLEHGDGRAVLRFTPEPIWTIGAGVVQGGIVTAMLDMAMAFASNGLSTATITIDILRPATVDSPPPARSRRWGAVSCSPPANCATTTVASSPEVTKRRFRRADQTTSAGTDAYSTSSSTVQTRAMSSLEL